MATQDFDYQDTSTLFAGGEVDDDLDTEPTEPVDRGDLTEPAEEPPAEEPKAEEPPQEEPPAEEPPAEEEPKEEPKAEEPPAEAEEEPPVDDNGLRIPKWRLDQEVAKRRRMEAEQSELKRRLQQLEQSQRRPEEEPKAEEPEEPEVDFTALDQQYHEAVLDGDTEKAAQLRQQIRQAERDAWMREAQSKAKQEATQVTEQDRIRAELTTEAEKVVTDYPILDQGNEAHDPEMLKETIALRDFYMQQMGYEPRYALREAADTVTLKYGYQSPAKAEETPPKAEEPPAEPDTTVADSLQRKQEMASRQPPKTGGTRNSGVINVDELPEEEFDKLSDADLARARGDLLE